MVLLEAAAEAGEGVSYRCSRGRDDDSEGTILLLGDAVAAHALARIIDPREDVLRDDIAGAHDTNADGEGRAVSAEPAPCRGEHGSGVEADCARSVWVGESRVGGCGDGPDRVTQKRGGWNWAGLERIYRWQRCKGRSWARMGRAGVDDDKMWCCTSVRHTRCLCGGCHWGLMGLMGPVGRGGL